jgi:hypothetical protein
MPRKMSEEAKRAQERYEDSPAQVKNREMRNKARLDAIKRLGKQALVGKDIDHRIPLDRGGGNAPSNQRILDVSRNRGWRRGKSGYNA